MTEKLITLCGLKNWDFAVKNKIRLKSHLSEWKLPKSSIPWNRHNQPVSIWQFIICNLSFSSHPPMSQCQTMARMSSIIVFFSSFIRRSWSRFRNWQCNSLVPFIFATHDSGHNLSAEQVCKMRFVLWLVTSVCSYSTYCPLMLPIKRSIHNY